MLPLFYFLQMKKPNGIAFIEVLIAAVIVGIILSTILASLNFTAKYIRHNANVNIVLSFLQGLMEEIKDIGYDELDAYNGYSDTVLLYQKENVYVNAIRNIGVVDTGQYKVINSNITWDWGGRTYTKTANTIMSRHN